MTIRSQLAALIGQQTGLPAEQVEALLETPPQPELGDYAFPCFALAKTLKKAPPLIAQELAGKLEGGFLERAVATGPYVNCFVSVAALAAEVFADRRDASLPAAKRETICIESPAPNTNKPLHLGHVRNMLLGVTVRTLLARRGHRVHALDLVNDRGVHICKSMLAYQMAGGHDTPASTGKKGDHFVGEYYVKFAMAAKDNPELEQEAQAMLVKWEDGDAQTRALWKKMRQWCLDGFAQSYTNFGVEIEKTYFESDIYLDGKDLVLDALAKGIFKRGEKNEVYADLEAEKLGTKVLLRGDGTAIYITQDIALAKKRFEEYNMDRMVYVVGNEQNHHFRVLFTIFAQLGFRFAPNCYHMSYGYVSLPTGRMKSREGTVVDADDLRQAMIDLAAEEVRKRSPDLDEADVLRRAEAIGMGALRFYILKYDPVRDFVYDPAESISFAGETGPYVQYTYARLSSMFRKAGVTDASSGDASFLNGPLEKQLLNTLLRYTAVVASSADKYEPYQLATYLIELAQLTNKYYHETQVLVDEETLRLARLRLLDAVRVVLKDGLGLLGITALEEM